MIRFLRHFVLAFVLFAGPVAFAQDEPPSDDALDVPQQVDVEDVVADDKIARHLRGIFETTDRIDSLDVRVASGVVFLSGSVASDEHREWAASLARRTEDVVAVVNDISVRKGPLLDFSDSVGELRAMYGDFMRSLPKIVTALIVLTLTIIVAIIATRLSRHIILRRQPNQLLLAVYSRAIGLLVFIIGLYVALRVSGLSQLALTVISGTGIAGLIIGIAFRDIAENFLASLLISMQRPFRAGDTIQVADQTGIVQKVTTRGTLLMAFDGSFVQIPNSTVYKATILNVSANPKTRFDFRVGVGYDVAAGDAQNIALDALRGHPAILNDPEPMVLLEELGSSTVNLRAYFWIDANEHSGLRVKSAALRRVKRAFQDAGISMPDDAREVVFPEGVPVRMIEQESADRIAKRSEPLQPPSQAPREADAVEAEGDLTSDQEDIQQQADESRLPEEGTDLLQSDVDDKGF